MFKWLEKLLGFGSVPAVIETVLTEPSSEAQKIVQKPTKKPQESVDLKSMKKAELLAHAKKVGIKANSSMNKGAIIKAIQNG